MAKIPIFVDDGGISSNTPPGASVSAAYPSTVKKNDLLFFIAFKDGTDSVVSSAPSGFSYILRGTVGGSALQFAIYYKRALNDGSEVGSESFTWDTDPDTVMAALIIQYRYVVSSGAYSNAGASTGGTSSSATIKGFTTTVDDTLGVNIAVLLGNNSTTLTIGTASGWTESQFYTITTGDDLAIKIQERNIPTATTISDQTSALPASLPWWGISMSLIPGGWVHNYLGVNNENIGSIGPVDLGDIQAVNTVE